MFGQPTKATFARIRRVLSRVFEGKKHPPPKKKKLLLLSLQYISNYIGKIIQTRRGQCTWRKYSLSKDTIVSQNAWNAPDFILAHIHLKKFLAPPKKARGIRPLGTSPPNDKSSIEPWSGYFWNRILFYTNQSSVHTKPLNPDTENVFFWNRCPERFKTPSTRSRIKNKQVKKCSDKWRQGLKEKKYPPPCSW